MDWNIEKYGATQNPMPVQEDFLSRYKRQLADSQKRTEDLTKLTALLEENPKILEILQLMGRL